MTKKKPPPRTAGGAAPNEAADRDEKPKGKRKTDDTGGDKPDEPTQAEKIIRLVLGSGADLWHDASQVAYVTVVEGDEARHMPLHGRACKSWIGRLYHEQSKAAPNRNAMSDARLVLEGRALHDGPEHEAHVRIAGDDSEIWADMCDGRVIRIDATGWTVLPSAQCPHRFTRRPGMLALPEPRRPGRLHGLWDIVNPPKDRALALAWVVCAFRPGRPYPILVVEGEQGSAKSTFCRVLRSLVDPREVPLRRPPKNDQDLAIACRNGWVIAVDNISSISGDLSDALCGVATGGGFEARTLYTDDEQTSLRMLRPVILNGITSIVRRPDLLDRAMVVRLPAIPDERRMPEDSLSRTIDLSTPYVLAALLDAVSTAIRRLPEVRATRRPLPRMADAALWAMAAAPALGLDDEIIYQAIIGARDRQARGVIEGDPVGGAILRLDLPWEGTSTNLLDALGEIVGERARGQRGWPGGARGMSSALDRLTPGLRRCGIEVTRRREGETGRRLISVARVGEEPSQASRPSRDEIDPPATPSHRDANRDGREDQPSRTNGELWPGSTHRDGSDTRDGRNPTSARSPNGNPGRALIEEITARMMVRAEEDDDA
jgi:hypothetical protein